THGRNMATEYETGEHWYKTNVWSTKQCMAIQGFKRNGDDMLGDEHAHNAVKTVNHFKQEHPKLIEKYHLSGGTPREGGG
ncbi:trehalase family glycosidase, partial [Salmonella enterica]|uniref:trehalase family glycosidase n=1 Tax=Salmonella enterica TaxID=28901 RepID=UPI003F1A7B1A